SLSHVPGRRPRALCLAQDWRDRAGERARGARAQLGRRDPSLDLLPVLAVASDALGQHLYRARGGRARRLALGPVRGPSRLVAAAQEEDHACDPGRTLALAPI